MEHHKGIEEDFFGTFQVTGTIGHKVRRGDSIWEISRRTYGVPAWLIRRHNPAMDLTRLSPGDLLEIPVVEPLG